MQAPDAPSTVQSPVSALRVAVLSMSGADEVGLGLCEAFRANECRVEFLSLNGQWPTGIDLYVIYGPMAPIGPLLLRLRSLPQRPSVAVWYTEPLPPPQPNWALRGGVFVRGATDALLRGGAPLLGAQRVEHLSRKAGRLRACSEMMLLHRWRMMDLLAVFTRRHAQVFSAWGLPAEIIPMGACSSFGRPMGLNRDIDVAFIGSTSDRRRGPIVDGLARRLAAMGIELVIRDGSPEHGYVFGAERAEMLNRTKILLSVMRQPWDDPVFRLLLAAPNGAMVLSEPVNDSGPFVSGRHFAIACVKDMPAVVRHYLRAEEECREISEAAFNLVTQELTMAAMARRFLLAWQSRTSCTSSIALPVPQG